MYLIERRRDCRVLRYGKPINADVFVAALDSHEYAKVRFSPIEEKCGVVARFCETYLGWDLGVIGVTFLEYNALAVFRLLLSYVQEDLFGNEEIILVMCVREDFEDAVYYSEHPDEIDFD